MKKSGIWSLYVSIYTMIMGVAFLFFPDHTPYIRFSYEDKAWVLITGMCLMGISYFNWTIFRERPLHILRASILNQAFCLVFLGCVAFLVDLPGVYGVWIMVFVGFVGLWLSYRSEHGSFQPGLQRLMPRTARWNIYVAGYTFLYGTASAVIPRLVLPWVGFDVPQGMWVRVAGMCFYYLCWFNIITYRNKGPAPIILSIMVLRIWFVLVLLAMGIQGYAWFVYLSAVIVSTGVIGTIISYRSESRLMSGV